MFDQEIASLGINALHPGPDLERLSRWNEPHGETLHAWRVGQQTVLTWNKGPKAGAIYDIVTVSEPDVPSAEQLLSEIDERLKQVSDGSLTTKYFSDWFNSTYYGSDSQSGLIKTGLASGQVTRLFSELEQTGINNWLGQRATDLQCSIPENRDIYDKPGKYGSSSLGIHQPIGKMPDLSNAHAVHYTSSTALDGILNFGALLSGNEIKTHGLDQLSGEGAKRSLGFTADLVSFCDFTYQEERGIQKTALGSAATFPDLSFSMAFIVSKDKADAVGFRKGGLMAIAGEIAVEGKVDLSLISAVVVPPFAMSDVQRRLEHSGCAHIAVLPSFRPN